MDPREKGSEAPRSEAIDIARPNFGRYQLIRRVSLGGMAEIYKAKAFGPAGFEKIVAIKRLLPHAEEDAELVARFVGEAKLLAQLDHHALARIYEVGQVPDAAGRPGHHYLAMEYVYGADLQDVMRALAERGRPADAAFVAAIGISAAWALDYVHSAGDAQGQPLHIVHRDVSPQNLMLDASGELKLIDFGIAKFEGSDVTTRAGVVKGKHAYMSPEQVRARQVDHRSDIFSLGIILWELAAGQRLFKGDSVHETLELVDRAEVPRLAALRPDLAPHIAGWIDACLARDPDDRPARAAHLAEALQDACRALGAGPFVPREVLKVAYRDLFGDARHTEDEVTFDEYRQALRAVELGEDAQLQRQRSDITIVPDTSDLAAYVAELRRRLPTPLPEPRAPSSKPEPEQR